MAVVPFLKSVLGVKTVSDVLLVGLIAAATALIAPVVAVWGVILANRSSRRQLGMQLKDSREQATAAREFAMRRDVYLAAAEAITRANAIFGLMPDPDVSNTEISSRLQEAGAAIARVQLVGRPSTVEAVMEYQTVALEAFVDLWPPRWSLLADHGQLTTLKKQIEATLQDRDRWLELMKQLNAKGQPRDEKAFGALMAQYRIAQNLLEQLVHQHNSLGDSITEQQLRFLELCNDKNLLALKPIQDAIAAGRTELGFDTKSDEWRQMMQRKVERTTAALRALAARARQSRAEQRARAAANKPPPQPPS